jgi:transcription-repair coupling factor (superfamily II helicase)
MSAPKTQTSIFKPDLPVRPGQQLLWSGLYGSSFGLAVVSAARHHDGPLVVVTPDNRRAQALEDEIRFYLGSDQDLPTGNAWFTIASHPIRTSFPGA